MPYTISGKRWTVNICDECGEQRHRIGDSCVAYRSAERPPFSAVEMMPVGEHEQWRDAMSEGWKQDCAVHERLREAALAADAAIERLLVPCRPVKYQPHNRDAVEQGEAALAAVRAALAPADLSCSPSADPSVPNNEEGT